jgi:predicted nucleic acid-binding protein
MPAYYLDSSALVKRYVSEIGSEWVRDLCDDAQNALFASELALVEVSSAFARRQRRGEISDGELQDYLDLFIGDCSSSYHLIPAERLAIDRAVDLTQRHPLRGYDAVQLACALAANSLLVAADLPSLIFVSADETLVAAARSEHLLAENPNAH